MKQTFLLVLIGTALLWAARPCEACREDATCLGSCAYETLSRTEVPAEQAEALLLLAHAWLQEGLTEGIARLVKSISEKVPPTDSLAFHARQVLAQAHYALGRTDSALFLYEQVAKEAAQYPLLQARALLAIGVFYAERGELLRAQGYLGEAAQLAEQLKAPLLQALVYNALSFVLAQAGSDRSRALHYAEAALQAAQDPKAQFHLLLGSPQKVRLAAVGNLAALYAETGQLQKAQELYNQLLSEAANDSVSRGQATLGLAQLYLSQGKSSEARSLLRTHSALFSVLPYSLQREWLRTEAHLALLQKRPEAAIQAYEKLLSLAETQALRMQNTRIEQLRILSGLAQREAELVALRQKQKAERIGYSIAAVATLIALLGLYWALRAARRRAKEEQSFREIITQQAREIEEKSRTLEAQNEELVRISETLAEALSTVQESYAAAKRLQRAILPDLGRFLPGSASYYEPMHEVGGDFYTMAVDPFSKRMLIVVGDCTGHGVSGAILAGIFAATVQNLFLQNPNQAPTTILKRLWQALSVVLRGEAPDGTLVPTREGADIALMIADFTQQTLHFGLAGRNVWIYDPARGLRELSGGRRGIDSFTPPDYEFPVYTEPLQKEALYYFFTDGLGDVLNPEGKKMGIKPIRTSFEDPAFCYQKPKDQLQQILQKVQAWKGSAPPNDDITLLILPGEALLAYARERLKMIV